MRSSSKPVSFRIATDEFEALASRAEATNLSPGGYARAVVLRELEGDLESQLDGLRRAVEEEHESLKSALAVLSKDFAAQTDDVTKLRSNLARVNENLRTALVALLVELTKSEDPTEAEEVGLDIIPPLDGMQE
jgi:hypothetical protein